MKKQWVGLSTDAKPTLAWSNNLFRGLDHGDEFYEQDTGATYIYHNGLDTWALKPNLVRPMVWDTTSLSYVAQTQTSIVTGSLTVSGVTDLTKIGGTAVGVGNPLFVSTQKPLTPQAPAQVDVGVVSEEICAANLTRKGMIVQNTSLTGYVSLGFGVAAVLKSGVYLFPGGTFWMDEYSLWAGKVNAIASEASVIVSVQDFAV